MSEHFETFHVLVEPTRNTKYPPAQSLVLALGAVLGHPAYGVWISAVLACAAIAWMLQAWLPTRWAFLGAFIFTTHVGIHSYWAQSYWGGMVAALGGALLYGAVRRMAEALRARDALAFGAGLVILANSRPFEGLVVSLPAWMVLLYALWKQRANGVLALTTRVAVPIAVVLAVGAGFMGLYNLRVTDSLWIFPYLTYEEHYNPAPLFLFQPSRPAPPYAIAEMATFYDWHLEYYHDLRTASGWAWETGKRALVSWFFFFGAALTLPFLRLGPALRSPWIRLAGVVSLALVLIYLSSVTRFPHYLAPATCLFLVVAVAGLQRLGDFEWRGRPIGASLVRAVPAASVIFLVACLVGETRANWEGWFSRRQDAAERLSREPGEHVVFVRYAPDHDVHAEWVYNRAKIDDAKVVWARDLGTQRNLEAISYFAGRRFWIIDADDPEGSLRPRPGSEVARAVSANAERP